MYHAPNPSGCLAAVTKETDLLALAGKTLYLSEKELGDFELPMAAPVPVLPVCPFKEVVLPSGKQMTVFLENPCGVPLAVPKDQQLVQ